VRELARHLGIHRHTVRAAYASLESQGLVSMRQGRGTTVLPYDIQRLAQAAPTTPTFTIGVLVPSLNPFYTPFVHGIEAETRNTPWLFLIGYTHDNPALGKRLLEQLVARRVDGLVVVPYVPETEAAVGRDGRIGALPPVVHVDKPDVPGHAVLLDSEGAAFRATSHLIEHGHRRIGIISGPLALPNLMECYAGYKKALNTIGLPVDRALIAEVPEFTLEMGCQAADRLLSLSDPPTAIFGAADLLAIGAMQAARARSLRVPDDVAIVGYNDIELASLVEPPLTTARAPAYDMGVAAMVMLQPLMLRKNVAPRRVTFDTHLVIRRSCGCVKS